jgi:hypothetical protein
MFVATSRIFCTICLLFRHCVCVLFYFLFVLLVSDHYYLDAAIYETFKIFRAIL